MSDYSSLPSFGNESARKIAAKFNSVDSICELLGSSSIQLQKLIQKDQYATYSIPKKRAGVRKIQAPYGDLKRLQSQLAENLLLYYRLWMNRQKGLTYSWGNIDPPYGGFTINYNEGQSPILSNAIPHVGHKYLLKLDITDFYSSLSTKEILHTFQWKLGVEPKAAYLLTLLCTRNDGLPTGAPTSSIISEMVMFDFDYLVSIWLKQRDGWTYSRYADDISISSEYPIDKDFVLDFIAQQLEEYGLKLNTTKTKYLKPHQAKYVTGVKINEVPNVNRRYVRNIRAVLHHWKSNGLRSASLEYNKLNSKYTFKKLKQLDDYFIKSVKGKINWIGQVKGVNNAVYLRLTEKYTMVLNV